MTDEVFVQIPSQKPIIEKDDEIYIKSKGRYRKFMDFYAFGINKENRLNLRKLARKMKRAPDDSYFMGEVLSKCLEKLYKDIGIAEIEKEKQKEMEFEITKLDFKRITHFIKREGIVNLVFMLKLKEVEKEYEETKI